MNINIELRAAEGGEDAKLLVTEQAAIYEAYAASKGLSCTRKSQGPG